MPKGRGIPHQVVNRVGNALSRNKLYQWWRAPSEHLGNRAPRDMWMSGHEQEVLNLIDAAKSGDMA